MRDPNAKTLINTKLVEEMKRMRLTKSNDGVNWGGLRSFLGLDKKIQVPELLVTMCPTFKHFKRFAHDDRVNGIRFNTAMISLDELEKEFQALKEAKTSTPVYYDVKARQMRIIEVASKEGNLELTLNHPIEVNTPCEVLFKAGADVALLKEVSGGGHILTFDGGPRYRLVPGESLHIRDKSFRNRRGELRGEGVITWVEKEKVQKAKAAGINKFFLSYVEQQSDIDELQEIVGKDAEIWLKIESIPGMKYVQESFQKRDNLVLVAARGDLFVELDKPHHMIEALRLIIKKDPEACVGSRLLLSVVDDPVPSCADLLEIAWLHDIGYRRMMLCDEICLKENLLSSAVAIFNGIKHDL